MPTAPGTAIRPLEEKTTLGRIISGRGWKTYIRKSSFLQIEGENLHERGISRGVPRPFDRGWAPVPQALTPACDRGERGTNASLSPQVRSGVNGRFDRAPRSSTARMASASSTGHPWTDELGPRDLSLSADVQDLPARQLVAQGDG